MNTHPTPTAEQLAEAAALRARSRGESAKREESFDRCDTDGFLSQWAYGLNAQEYAAKADILEHGGCAQFLGLYRDGVRVPAKIIETQFGARWMLCDAATGRTAGSFYPVGRMEDGKPVNSKRAKLVKDGFEERLEWAPAVAKCIGVGTGLSGRAWIATLRADGGWPGAPQWRIDEDAKR